MPCRCGALQPRALQHSRSELASPGGPQPAYSYVTVIRSVGIGPCGPCTELYYDLEPGRPAEGATQEDDTRFLEFYNLVFMESNKGPGGDLTPLAARNIDTGLGLERMAQILQARKAARRPEFARCAAAKTLPWGPAHERQGVKTRKASRLCAVPSLSDCS